MTRTMPRPLARTLALTLALLVGASVVPPMPMPAAAADDVKIALVAPLSGRWARQGQLKKMGADLARTPVTASRRP